MTISDDDEYIKICKNIAEDIKLLKIRFQQLSEFEISQNLQENCKISYGYHTHKSERRVGWVGAVPNPDADGIWFYIRIWDENDPAENTSQINTQPVLPPWYIKNRRVTFLLLEGEKTNPAGPEILRILIKHGLVEK